MGLLNKKEKYGIMSRKDFMKRSIAIAKGEYKPKKDEPKVWYASRKIMREVLKKK